MKWNAEQLRRIDLRWHDLRHEDACRLLADGVDIRIIQLMLGHASIQQTQRYLNVTDEELRKGLEVNWGRQLRAVSGPLGRLQPSRTARAPDFLPCRKLPWPDRIPREVALVKTQQFVLGDLTKRCPVALFEMRRRP